MQPKDLAGLESEFWAAIVGATVGGADSILGQEVASRRQARQHDAGLAHAFLFKLIRMNAVFMHIRDHLDEGAARAKADGVTGRPALIATDKG